MIAISVSENAMLTVHEETTSPSQLPSAYLEQLNGRICREDEVLVGSNEHENDHEGSADDHSVGEDGNGVGREDCAQVDPPADRRRQLANALVREKRNNFLFLS